MIRFAAATLLCFATATALADEIDTIRLLCRADNKALAPQPLTFSIDTAAKEATETSSGTRFGVTAYRDGFGLWEPDGGPTALVYRIDRITGRFTRIDKQLRLEGSCEKAEQKF
jgi:hypothetical protein